MKTVCHFHVIRFMPFFETGEFANVGVVMYSPATGFFDYRLAPSNFGRVKSFFKELDNDLYKLILSSIESEFEYIKELVELERNDISNIMNELTRPRDGMILYSNKRSVLTTNPEQALENEYLLNVGRVFASRVDFEQKMASEIRNWIKPSIVGAKYKRQKLNTQFYEFELPLVAQVAEEIKAIKPLAFKQKNALLASDHVNTWIGRAKNLIKAGTVQSHNLLFAMQPPEGKHDDIVNIYGDARHELNLNCIPCIEYDDKVRLIEFAKFNLDSDSFKLA
ncbi:DUF3037 domain-containing protein [Vibrio alginolyticus]|uniref:DUF3037 domain-containing protein n=1 Tax=Vibrio alginolyticus TaxID=663 RepID=UPI00211A5ABF|nr:DUF3037 domain-containing protein [Vibrio alginolyticus]MCQ9087401.1 DUF3037 domain-containing protein [Vibrio alginolyticus]